MSCPPGYVHLLHLTVFHSTTVTGLLCSLHAGICLLLCCDGFPAMGPWDAARHHFETLSQSPCTAFPEVFDTKSTLSWGYRSSQYFFNDRNDILIVEAHYGVLRLFCFSFSFYLVTTVNYALFKFLEKDSPFWFGCDQVVRFTQCVDPW